MGKEHSDTNISSAGPVSNEDSRHSEGKSQFSNTDQNAKEKKQAQTSMHEQFKEASMDKGKPYAVNPGTGAQAAQ